MKEVAKEIFYKFIGNKDIVSSHTGAYPYSTHCKIRGTGVDIAVRTCDGRFLIKI